MRRTSDRAVSDRGNMRIYWQRISVAGFTIVELLVVIAVIGILFALLLPALGCARNKSAHVTDLSNLRQQTQALHLFAGDNNDALPWPNWDDGGGSRPGWLYTPDLGVTGPARYHLEAGLFWFRLQNPKVYMCPMDKPGGSAFEKRRQQISSYV